MKIVAHRGHWLHSGEKNAHAAFVRAFEGGAGIETDLRDASGTVVIAHDLPAGGEMTLDQFLALAANYSHSRPLALNIKADGLQQLVKEALARHTIDGAFVFDMSVPDTLGYLRHGVPVYTRCSEYEPAPPCLEQAVGVWLDAFHGEWYDWSLVRSWLVAGKAVCIVSPELHGRPHLDQWEALRANNLHGEPLLSLCTDFPNDAKDFFRV
ncbi:MAG TPA: hypothetical protein VF774_22480 [Pseudoduganella sp.]|jgi:hypothetical protein